MLLKVFKLKDFLLCSCQIIPLTTKSHTIYINLCVVCNEHFYPAATESVKAVIFHAKVNDCCS